KSRAKVRDGSPGKLGGPTHVHVQENQQIGSAVEQMTRPGRLSDLPGAQVARHKPRRIGWTPEAKQISDRVCVAGSRSTSIVPVTSGNRTHRDPIEESGVPCGESR